MNNVIRHVDFEVPDWGEFAVGPQMQRGYRSEVMADEPAAYWRLGEAGGSVLVDELGVSHGSYAGGVTLAEPGALEFNDDPAAAFDGATGYASVPVIDAINTLGSAGAIEVWCKCRSFATDMNLFDCRTLSGALRAYHLAPATINRTPGIVRFTAGGNTSGPYYDCTQITVLTDVAVEVDRWVHLVAVYDGPASRIYVDGADRTVSVFGTYGPLPVVTDNPMRIGRHPTITGNYFFNGCIDEIAIYRHALDADRVMAHYRAGVGR
jgi:hypothetical protein